MAKTISEISEATGYSRTTITMVLNGRAEQYRISKRAQKIITDYVAKHGVTINQTARNLKTSRSRTVGFIAPDLANTFFARIMARLEEYCRAEDLVLITTSSRESPQLEQKALRSLLERGVDGLVVAPCSPLQAQAAQRSAKAVPLVLIDRDYDVRSFPVVSSDHEASARNLTREMISSGVANIAFLCGHPDIPSVQARMGGFRAAIAEAQFDVNDTQLLSDEEDSVEAGQRMMEALLQDPQKSPAAILCSSLLVLEGALYQLKLTTGSIPSEMMIGAFDYDGMLHSLPNPVVIARQDEDALAKSAFQLLFQQMQSDAPIGNSKEIFPAEMMRLDTP
ncbi:substrate-binding domain-containing protein [Celeribacter sp.]|uniref:substrate-binding domain-containing protein n=1 Tax=Celeribacter sp. TaxID=1890673 RepID=UPI003A94BEF6